MDDKELDEILIKTIYHLTTHVETELENLKKHKLTRKQYWKTIENKQEDSKMILLNWRDRAVIEGKIEALEKFWQDVGYLQDYQVLKDTVADLTAQLESLNMANSPQLELDKEAERA